MPTTARRPAAQMLNSLSKDLFLSNRNTVDVMLFKQWREPNPANKWDLKLLVSL